MQETIDKIFGFKPSRTESTSPRIYKKQKEELKSKSRSKQTSEKNSANRKPRLETLPPAIIHEPTRNNSELTKSTICVRNLIKS